MKLWGLTEPRQTLASTVHLGRAKICHMLLLLFDSSINSCSYDFTLFFVFKFDPSLRFPSQRGLYFCQPKAELEVKGSAGLWPFAWWEH